MFVFRTREPGPATSPKRLKVSYRQVVSAMPPAKRRRTEESIVEDIKPIITVSWSIMQGHQYISH